MVFKKTAVNTYRTAATQGPESKPQASTPSFSVNISQQAEHLARGKATTTQPIRKKK